MSVRETSLERYRSLESSGALQGQESVLMRLVHRHFPFPAKFTRRELKEKAGWEMSTIAGRINGLIQKHYLTEFPETRDGGHLLQVTTSQPNAAAPAETPSPKPDTQAVERAAAAPHEQLIHSYTAKGKPLVYTASGVGPGWPVDQDHLHSKHRRAA